MNSESGFCELGSPPGMCGGIWANWLIILRT
jgi:hypothetical protein